MSKAIFQIENSIATLKFSNNHGKQHHEQKDGRWYERTGSVVISEQKNKMGGVQHVYNGRDNIALMQLWSVNTD